MKDELIKIINELGEDYGNAYLINYYLKKLEEMENDKQWKIYLAIMN